MIELHNDVLRFIEHGIDELKSYFATYEEILFKEIKLPQTTLYLIYDVEIVFYKEEIASYELKENGIIYKNDGEYYYYNFNDDYEKKEEIVKKFVETYLLG